MQCSVRLAVHAQSSLSVDGEWERDTGGDWEKERERAREGERERGRGSFIILGFHSYRKHHSHRKEFIVDTMWEVFLLLGLYTVGWQQLGAQIGNHQTPVFLCCGMEAR